MVNRSREQGFTLLELMVALSLAAIISLSISSVGTQAQRIYEATTSKVDVYQKFRYALRDMETTLRGWEPTTSLEYFVDVNDQNSNVGKNSHWDEGEEQTIKGPNLAGGIPDRYDEGAKIIERTYTIVNGPFETKHDAYSVYFRGPVTIDGVSKLANVEYLLVDPRTIQQAEEDDRDVEIFPIGADSDEEIVDNTNLVLLKVVRYLDINADNYDRDDNVVKQTITEICSGVTDLRIEYFYDNIFDQRSGAFCTPSTERDLVRSESPPKEISSDVWVKEFLYGGFNDFSRGVGVRGRRDVATGVDEPTYFQARGGADDNRFSQLSLGDSIFIWSDGATQFPIDEYTVRRNDNGKLYFDEPIDSTEWDSDQSSLRFRAAYVPTAVRVSIRVLNDEGLEPRTLSIMVHPYNAVR